MKFLLDIISNMTHKASKRTRKTIKDYQREVITKQGADQFKKLMKFGQMPVTFL